MICKRASIRPINSRSGTHENSQESDGDEHSIPPRCAVGLMQPHARHLGGAQLAYGRCLRPALYSSLRSSPSHPTGVSALRVTIAIANARKQWGASQVNCQVAAALSQ